MQEFNWAFWINGTKALLLSHATIAREAAAAGNPANDTDGGNDQPDNKSLEGDYPGLFHAITTVIRIHGYSIRMEQACLQWVERLLMFHGWHPADSLTPEGVSSFLEHLAVKRNVAASTHNQAMNALMFLYHHIFQRDEQQFGSFVRAKTPQKSLWC